MLTVDVEFTCKVCDINACAPTRERAADEEILAWMDVVILTVAQRHAALSPRCPARQVDLKIPMNKHGDDYDPIGTARRQ